MRFKSLRQPWCKKKHNQINKSLSKNKQLQPSIQQFPNSTNNWMPSIGKLHLWLNNSITLQQRFNVLKVQSPISVLLILKCMPVLTLWSGSRPINRFFTGKHKKESPNFSGKNKTIKAQSYISPKIMHKWIPLLSN